MKYYHGTSAHLLPQILKEGLKANAPKLWTCSKPGTYLWGPEGYFGVDYREFALPPGKCQAFLNCTPAMVYYNTSKAIIIEIELPEEEILVDDTCPAVLQAFHYPKDITLDNIVAIEESSDYRLWIPILAYWLKRNTYLPEPLSKANEAALSTVAQCITAPINHTKILTEALEWKTVFTNQKIAENELNLHYALHLRNKPFLV